jgi:PAS domain S-box-containing protein
MDQTPAPEAIPFESAEELYESAPFAYVSLRTDGRIVRANRTLLAWTGRALPDLVGGGRFQDLLTAGGRIFYETHVLPLLRLQGTVNEIAYDIVRADGTTFPALVNGIAVPDAEGRPALYRLTLVDATDRRAYERELQAARRRAEEAGGELRRLNENLEEAVRTEVERRLRAEEALRHAQKMEALGQLTGSVAHDFNNLLGAILSNLEVAERYADETGRRFIANAVRSVGRGEALTQRMLAFGRKQQLHPVRVDLAGLLTGVRDLLERSLGDEARLVVAVPDDLPPALVDANQLELALMNLAVNARHAMPDGGTLTLSVARETIAEARSRRAHAGRLPAHRCGGHRHRHGRGDARQGGRAVLHHQALRTGDRPRAVHGARARGAVGRSLEPREPPRRGRHRDDPAARRGLKTPPIAVAPAPCRASGSQFTAVGPKNDAAVAQERLTARPAAGLILSSQALPGAPTRAMRGSVDRDRDPQGETGDRCDVMARAAAAGAATGLPGGALAQAKPSVLRVVPHANLQILDPIFTTIYISRNHGYMIDDTLFALDDKLQPQPQMVDTAPAASSAGAGWCAPPPT